MRTLVIAPQPFFSPRGTPLSVYYRTLVLAELGAQIDLLTYGQGSDVEIPGVRVVRIPELPFCGVIPAGPSLVKAILDVLVLFWATGLLAKNRYEVVHAHEEAVFLGHLLRPVFKFKLVYDMHSSLPEQLRNFKFTRSRQVIRILEVFEKRVLQSADAVITICPALAEKALQCMPDCERHFLIENSIFEEVRCRDAVLHAPFSDPSPDLPHNRPVVAYLGSFEEYQGLDLLIAAFARVLHVQPDAFLLIAGGRKTQVERYQRLAELYGLQSSCMIMGQVSDWKAKQFIEKATVLTSIRTGGSNTPLKIYQQLASGKPLVATNVHSHTQVLNDRVCFLVKPEPRDIAEGILKALDEAECRKIVRAASLLYQRKYSKREYVGKMRLLVRNLQDHPALSGREKLSY